MILFWLGCVKPVSVPAAATEEPVAVVLPAFDHNAREHYLRAQVALQRGELDQALESMRKARLFDPENPRLRAEEARLRALAQDPG